MSTHSPASICSLGGFTTRKQFPRTTAPMSPEPSHTVLLPPRANGTAAVWLTCAGQLTRAGTKCATPPFSFTGMRELRFENWKWPRHAAQKFFDRGDHKQLKRDHGRNGIARQPEHRSAPAPAENHRLAGPDRDRVKEELSVPRSSSTFSTRSYFPAETPPLSNSISDSSPCSDPRAEVRHLVLGEVRSRPVRASERNLRGERDVVAVANLKWPGGDVDGDEFVAGRKNRDARTAADLHARVPDFGGHGELGISQARPARDDGLSDARPCAAST